MLVLSLAVRWLECTLHIGMSLMLMITMVKNLLSMSEGFGWQRYKKYLYQSPTCREIAADDYENELIYRGNREFLRGELCFSSEERKNSSDL